MDKAQLMGDRTIVQSRLFTPEQVIAVNNS
jgi:hypothetical protein